MTDRPGHVRNYRFKNQWRTTLRRRVLERDGYRCRFCGYPGDDGHGRGLTLAHYPIPAGPGVPNDEHHVVTACRSCHGRIDGGRSHGGRG